MLGNKMVDVNVVIGNLLFWPAWFLVSSIPYLLNQYAIDNYEKIQDFNSNKNATVKPN